MTGGMPIGDDDLHGYVDKRLPPERMAAVETYIATHPDAAAQVLQYREQRQALRSALSINTTNPSRSACGSPASRPNAAAGGGEASAGSRHRGYGC